MKRKGLFTLVLLVLLVLIGLPHAAIAQLKPGDPIEIGVPTALGSIEGRDGWMAIQMAVEEINAKGGVQVGNTKHKLEAYSIDTREHEPGIPVQYALTATEKLILERKPHAILLGNFRSEVLFASMDLMAIMTATARKPRIGGDEGADTSQRRIRPLEKNVTKIRQ